MVFLNLMLIALAGYLAGSIPTAIVAGKLLRGIDIREHGSGNAGGTNVMRVLGWKPGIAVILFDMLKGAAATLLIAQISLTTLPVERIYLELLAGLSAVAGHIWSVFARFRGGKGVATATGMLFALMPLATAISMGLFMVLAFTTRYVSLASIMASLVLPIVLLILYFGFGERVPAALFAVSALVAALIVYTHRANIKRLFAGTENRFGETSRPPGG